jgi:hypothetical protein
MAEDFAVSVARWCDQAATRADEAFRRIAWAALARVQELTPVRTGYLRANWVALKEGEAVPKPGSSQGAGSVPPEQGLFSAAGSTVGGYAGGFTLGQALASAGKVAGRAAGPVGTFAGTAIGQAGGQALEGSQIKPTEIIGEAAGSTAGYYAGGVLGAAVGGPAGAVVGGLVGGAVGGLAGQALVRAPDGSGGITSARIGDKILIVNPVAYARRIEFGFVGEDSRGRRFSQQGRGMMQQTIAEIPVLAERVLAQMRGQG